MCELKKRPATQTTFQRESSAKEPQLENNLLFRIMKSLSETVREKWASYSSQEKTGVLPFPQSQVGLGPASLRVGTAWFRKEFMEGYGGSLAKNRIQTLGLVPLEVITWV